MSSSPAPVGYRFRAACEPNVACVNHGWHHCCTARRLPTPARWWTRARFLWAPEQRLPNLAAARLGGSFRPLVSVSEDTRHNG